MAAEKNRRPSSRPNLPGEFVQITEKVRLSL